MSWLTLLSFLLALSFKSTIVDCFIGDIIDSVSDVGGGVIDGVNILDPINDIKDTVNNIPTIVHNVNEIVWDLQEMATNIDDIPDIVTTRVTESLEPTIESVTSTLKPTIIGVTNNVYNALSPTINNAVNTITNELKPAIDAAADEVIDELGEVLGDLADTIGLFDALNIDPQRIEKIKDDFVELAAVFDKDLGVADDFIGIFLGVVLEASQLPDDWIDNFSDVVDIVKGAKKAIFGNSNGSRRRMSQTIPRNDSMRTLRKLLNNQGTSGFLPDFTTEVRGSMSGGERKSFEYYNAVQQAVVFTNCLSNFDTNMHVYRKISDTNWEYITSQSYNNCDGDDCSDSAYDCSGQQHTETMSFRPLAIGTYRIDIRPHSNIGGDYVIESVRGTYGFLPGFRSSVYSAIEYGSSETKSHEYYNGAQQTVVFTNCHSYFDTKMYVYRKTSDTEWEDITSQSYNQCGGDDCSSDLYHCSRSLQESIEYRPLEIGTYRIDITTFHATAGGNYAIDVWRAPTASPTSSPTTPTKTPTFGPTGAPTMAPTVPPTVPSRSPTGAPTMAPTGEPTMAPTVPPTSAPTEAPSSIAEGCIDEELGVGICPPHNADWSSGSNYEGYVRNLLQAKDDDDTRYRLMDQNIKTEDAIRGYTNANVYTRVHTSLTVLKALDIYVDVANNLYDGCVTLQEGTCPSKLNTKVGLGGILKSGIWILEMLIEAADMQDGVLLTTQMDKVFKDSDTIIHNQHTIYIDLKEELKELRREIGNNVAAENEPMKHIGEQSDNNDKENDGYYRIPKELYDESYMISKKLYDGSYVISKQLIWFGIMVILVLIAVNIVIGFKLFAKNNARTYMKVENYEESE